MKGKTITLKYAGTCRDCGAKLEAGSRATWYGRGKVYGLDCHERSPRSSRPKFDGSEPLGLTYSKLDKYGVYAADGTHMGSTCGCEDYPCCGH